MRTRNLGVAVSILVSALCLLSCSSQNTPTSQAPNVTLVNHTPLQITLTLTSKASETKIEHKIDPGEEKKVLLNGGAYDLMTLYSDHGRMQSISSEGVFVAGQEKWVFEQRTMGFGRTVQK